MNYCLTWPVGICTGFQTPLTFPLHSPNGRQFACREGCAKGLWKNLSVILFFIIFRQHTVMDSSNRFMLCWILIYIIYTSHCSEVICGSWRLKSLTTWLFVCSVPWSCWQHINYQNTALLACCDWNPHYISENITITYVYYYHKKPSHCFLLCFRYISMAHNTIISYFRLPYFHVSNNALFFT